VPSTYPQSRLEAVGNCLLDALVVGGWIAAGELDHRPAARRRARAALVSVYCFPTIASATVETAREIIDAWPDLDELDTSFDLPPLVDLAKTAAPHLILGVLWLPFPEKRAVRALERRGVTRPHLVLGLLVAAAHAATALPIWLRQAKTAQLAREHDRHS